MDKTHRVSILMMPTEKQKVVKATKEYFETEDEKVYFFEPLEKEISVEDMQKVVDASENLVKELKNGSK